MTIRQLESPCWKPCAPGEKPTGDGVHWLTRESAAGQADPGDVVLALPHPCWVATCDGLPGAACGVELENLDEGWTVHGDDPAQLNDAASREGWETGAEGDARCAECISEDLELGE